MYCVRWMQFLTGRRQRRRRKSNDACCEFPMAENAGSKGNYFYDIYKMNEKKNNIVLSVHWKGDVIYRSEAIRLHSAIAYARASFAIAVARLGIGAFNRIKGRSLILNARFIYSFNFVLNWRFDRRAPMMYTHIFYLLFPIFQFLWASFSSKIPLNCNSLELCRSLKLRGKEWVVYIWIKFVVRAILIHIL